MWNDRYSGEGLRNWGRVFDPVTLTAISIGATVAGGAASAAGTLAGGKAAAQAGELQKSAADYQATELEQNASQAFASGQRKALDTQQRTRMAESTSLARASASGVNAGVGSPVTNRAELAKRGEYQALTDMFNGDSEATGLRNQAKGVEYSGDIAELEGKQKQQASYLAAAGTLAGSLGSATSSYGAYKYPNLYGRPGAQV